MGIWADSWLKTPGCGEIKLEFEIGNDGKFDKVLVNQTCYNLNNTPQNILRN